MYTERQVAANPAATIHIHHRHGYYYSARIKPRLQCGFNFNPHTDPIPTKKPEGIPKIIPMPTEPRNPPHPYPAPCVFSLDAYFCG